MTTSQYFFFNIHSVQRLPSYVVKDDSIKVVVMSAAQNVLKLNEVFYNANDRVVQILAYQLDTRVSLNSSSKSGWLWVNAADVADGQVRIDEESTRLTKTTKTQWVLSYTGGQGNSSTYYYDRATGLLAQATGHYVRPNYDVTTTVTRTSSGLGGQAVEQPSSSSYVASASPPDGPPRPTSTWYYPPWWLGSWGEEHYGYGVWTYEASGSYNTQNGAEWTDTKAGAGPFFGGARAQVWSYMYFPNPGYFTVSTTGTYTMKTHHTLNGVAYLAIACRPPWGCAFADGWVWVRHQLYYKSNGVPVGELKETTIYDAPPLPGWVQWWTNVHFDQQSNYYLTAGTQYYGCDWIQGKQIAAAVGIIAFAYSHVHGFESKLNYVEIWKIA